MTIQETTLVGIAIVNFLIAVYVIAHKARSRVHQVFFVMTTGVAFWIGGIPLLSSTKNFIFDKVILYGGLFFIYGLYALAKTFPNNEQGFTRPILQSLPFLIIAAILPFNLVIKKVEILSNGHLKPVNGPLFPIYAGILSIYMLLSLVIFAQHYIRSRGKQRIQIQYFFLGMSIFVSSALIFDLILPAFHYFKLNLVGPFASILFISGTAYAIIKHQLLDIRIVIQRGIIYSLLLWVILVLYILFLMTFGYLFHLATNVTTFVAGFFTILAGIYGARPIEVYFRKITDNIFFKDKYNYSEALHELSYILNHTIETESIIKKSSSKLQEILKSKYITLVPLHAENVTKDQIKNVLGSYTDTLVFPVALDNDLLGVLRVGEKRSGDAYTSEDKKLLNTFTHQLAIALEKANLYEQVKEYSESLERKVKKRTEQLHIAHIAQRQNMADIAHSLLTPLTVARGELGLLQDELDKDNENLKALDLSIQRVTRFIHDMLNLAQLESMDESLKKEPVNMSKLLRNMIEYLEIIGSEKDIRISTDIDDEIVVCGTKEKLEELITSLASNAIKYMRKSGEKKIFISLKRDSGNAVFKIKDTGIGIPEEDIQFIFNRFYRARNTRENRNNGSGLGLSIAKKIVEKHDGFIVINSTVGKGTTLTVSLPLLDKKE